MTKCYQGPWTGSWKRRIRGLNLLFSHLCDWIPDRTMLRKEGHSSQFQGAQSIIVGKAKKSSSADVMKGLAKDNEPQKSCPGPTAKSAISWGSAIQNMSWRIKSSCVNKNVPVSILHSFAHPFVHKDSEPH